MIRKIADIDLLAEIARSLQVEKIIWSGERQVTDNIFMLSGTVVKTLNWKAFGRVLETHYDS